MLSRLTLFSLLLALMLGLGIMLQTKSQLDRCNSYSADGIPPRSEYVVTGTREVEVPCSDWWMRQSLTIQILCIADLGLGMIFVVNALGDLHRWLELRRPHRLR
jgi:hypothetical protein